MPRIENAAIESDIADSLLGDEPQQEQQEQQEESQYAESGADLLDEAIQEQTEGRTRFDGGDTSWEAKYAKPEEARQEQLPERLRSERAPEEAGQEQPQPEHQFQWAEATPAQIEEGIAALGRTVQQNGLNDEATRRELAAGFCESLGSDVDRVGMNVEQFGFVSAKTMLSTNQIYDAVGGDLSKLPAIPEQSAKAWAHDVLTSWGIDPRTMPTDASYLARTVQGALFSVLNTSDRLGGTTDVQKINDKPEVAEFYYGHFIAALTGQTPPDKQQMNESQKDAYQKAALKFADTWAKYALAQRAAYRQIVQREQASQQKQPRARGQRIPAQFREGMKGSKAPRFKTNSGPDDPFDKATMDTYYERTARL